MYQQHLFLKVRRRTALAPLPATSLHSALFWAPPWAIPELAELPAIDLEHRSDDDKTALHVCSLSKKEDTEGEWKAIECAELLIQNGAKIDTRDKSSHGVIDLAVIGNADLEMIEYLNMKGS